MKVIIMGGFLGSGKTSVLIQMAKHLVGDNPEENASKVVIVENEIGEVGIDDKILKGGGYSVTGMFSGCVCCTMAGELTTNFYNIMNDLNPEYIIMEATGVAYPLNIKETLESSLNLDSKIVCLVDATRWKRLLGPMSMLIPTQLEGADIILINKIDAVDAATADDVEASVRGFQNDAEFFRVSATEGIDEKVWDAIGIIA